MISRLQKKVLQLGHGLWYFTCSSLNDNFTAKKTASCSCAVHWNRGTNSKITVVDPDPKQHFYLMSWIRIRVRIGNADPDPGAWK